MTAYALFETAFQASHFPVFDSYCIETCLCPLSAQPHSRGTTALGGKVWDSRSFQTFQKNQCDSADPDSWNNRHIGQPQMSEFIPTSGAAITMMRVHPIERTRVVRSSLPIR